LRPLEAIAQYRQVIALDPKYVNAYYGLGIALKDQGKLEEAIAAYRQALSLPDDTTLTHHCPYLCSQ
jgi:superkiller protein 3